MSALVVFSGGQDSTTCLYWALNHHHEVHALTFNYGQRHEREIVAAGKIARDLGLSEKWFVANIPGVLKSTSPLVDHSQRLEQYESFNQMDQIIGDRIEKTFVPMRNALFLVVAANYAVALGCRQLVTGVCQEDSANYPDCRESFIQAQELAINEALGVPDRIIISTPLIHIPKHDAIRHMVMNLPGCYKALAYSHTSYDGQWPPTGNDHATVLRRESFAKAGVPDPLVARAQFEGLWLGPVPNMPDHITNLDDLVKHVGAA